MYITGSTADGRTTVTFGDGVNGARLPSGHENVRARYRFGTGKAANVAADRDHPAAHPPARRHRGDQPAPGEGRRGRGRPRPDPPRRSRSPCSALDRLVSASDYEDFARSRAGIGRAAARELFDGRRRVLHVTVAGTDDVPIDGDSDTLRALRGALTEYGDLNLTVRVDVRELVLLLVAAKVKVAQDHAWEIVEPRLRQALLNRLGYEGRELGRPARLSDVLAAAHSVPGVDYVDVDVFTGVAASATPEELTGILTDPGPPKASVPAREATYDEKIHTVRAANGETLSEICRHVRRSARRTPAPQPRHHRHPAPGQGPFGVRLPRYPPGPARAAVAAGRGHPDSDGGQVMAANSADVQFETANPATTSREPDGLAALLPRWHLLRDAEEGEPLRALLAVIAEQLDRVRDGVEQGYEDLFVETAAPWVLPYLGDLVGYRTLPGYERVLTTGLHEGGRAALAEAVAPRADVAATVANRRRKGTLAPAGGTLRPGRRLARPRRRAVPAGLPHPAREAVRRHRRPPAASAAGSSTCATTPPSTSPAARSAPRPAPSTSAAPTRRIGRVVGHRPGSRCSSGG